MKRFFCLLWLPASALLAPVPAAAQAGAEEGVAPHAVTSLDHRISVRHHEPMFTVWAWIIAADTTDRYTRISTPLQELVRERVIERLEPSYMDTLRQAYALFQDDTQFGYHVSVWSLFLTPPPHMRLELEAEKAQAARDGNDRYLEYLDRLEGWGETLVPLLNEFHHRAGIAFLCPECRDWQRDAVSSYKQGTIDAIRVALDYLRMDEGALASMGPVVVVPSGIGPLGSAMAPTVGGTTYNLEFPTQPVDNIRFHAHEYIHFMVWHLTRGGEYRDRIEGITARVWDDTVGENARRYYPDPVAYFDECLVRVLTAATLLGGLQNDRARRSVQAQADRGFVLATAMAEALHPFEDGHMEFDHFFPGWLDRLEATVPDGG